MKDNTQEKNLIERNENNIFGKIKSFFRKIFSKKEENTENEIDESVLEEAEKSYNFREYIKRTEDEETVLFELQRRYHNGEVSIKELTNEQINALCDLYDDKIADLKKTIAAKEQILANYKKGNRAK